MRITIDRNTGKDSEGIPYFACVEILTATIDTGSLFAIPIYAKHLGQKKRFFVDVCGFRLEDEILNELPTRIEQLLTGLINISRLPTYVFIARRAKGVYPVYTIDEEVFATTPGGPIFKHVELAKVREYLSDYLHDAGILGEVGLSDTLHVRGINPHTLGLRRPVFYLKKRVPDEVDFWAPVFESGDGKRIYAYAANARREAPIGGGQETLFLRELVAQSLLTDKRLTDLHDLRPDRLQTTYWDRLKQNMSFEGNITVKDRTIPLYSNNYVWVGQETRPDEDRYSLFVGQNAQAIKRRVEVDFKRRGI